MPNVIFICSNCGSQFPKWSGRCLECGKWGTLEQEIRDKPALLCRVWPGA